MSSYTRSKNTQFQFIIFQSSRVNFPKNRLVQLLRYVYSRNGKRSVVLTDAFTHRGIHVTRNEHVFIENKILRVSLVYPRRHSVFVIFYVFSAVSVYAPAKFAGKLITQRLDAQV